MTAELAATVFALAGVRAGDVVLDLTPAAGLTAGFVAGAGRAGRVLALRRDDDSLAGVAGATGAGVESISEPADLAGSDVRVAKVVCVQPEAEARALTSLLLAVRPLLAPGARVTAASRSGAGALTDGLPSVLAECGLVVVHAEGMSVVLGSTGQARRLALAVGRPGPTA